MLIAGSTRFHSSCSSGRNYEYDGSGNLVHDRSEYTLIRWNAQGKVVEVRKDLAGVSQTTKFWYNAAGNRVKKQVFNHLAPLENGADTSSVTYYVRDANEAVMAIYQQKVIHTSGMFGCLRKPSNNVGGDGDLDGVVDGGCDNCRPLMPGGLPGGEWNPWQEDYDRDGVGDACDPCPFHFSPPNAPCVGPPFLPEPEVWPGIAVTTTLAELPIYGSERIGLLRPNALRDTSFYLGAIFTRQVGKKEYELKDHLGNVRVVVSDLKGKEGTVMLARVKSVNSYYAFGMLEEGMSGSSGGYRYGYNGKEMDNELKGEGNSLDYGARMYDPRLGRWGSVDPLVDYFPGVTPYSYVVNSPLMLIDPSGARIEAIFPDKTRYTEAEKAALKRAFNETIEALLPVFPELRQMVKEEKVYYVGLNLQGLNGGYFLDPKELELNEEDAAYWRKQIQEDEDGRLYSNPLSKDRISWDPFQVTRYKGGIETSPVQSFIHEILHLYRFWHNYQKTSLPHGEYKARMILQGALDYEIIPYMNPGVTKEDIDLFFHSQLTNLEELNTRIQENNTVDKILKMGKNNWGLHNLGFHNGENVHHTCSPFSTNECTWIKSSPLDPAHWEPKK